MIKKYKGHEFYYEIYPSVIMVCIVGGFSGRIKYLGYTVNEAIKKHYESVVK